MDIQKCPYKIGDTVIYRPSLRGHSHVIMTELGQLLQKDGTYTIARIDKDVYVVLCGHEHSVEGGIYWTEFAPVCK